MVKGEVVVILSRVAVVVVMFANPPGFAYVIIGCYCWSLGPLIECTWWSSSHHYWVEFAGHRRWVGFVWICHQWCRFVMVGFDGIGHHWVGLAHIGSAHVGPLSLSLVVVGVALLVIELDPLVWSSNCCGFPLLHCFMFLYFTTLFSHLPLSPFPFSHPSFPSPLHPHPFGKGRGG